MHKNTWVVYDVGCAGCSTCGHAHLCGLDNCESVQNTDGEEICCITGTWLGKLNLCNNEFVDSVYTPSLPSSNSNTRGDEASASGGNSHQPSIESFEYQIQATPLQLMCSPEWESCRANEIIRYAGKACDVLVRDLRLCKEMVTKNKVPMPSIAEVLARSVATISSFEQPVIVPEDQRKRICSECSAVIRRHIHCMVKMKSQLLSTPQKAKGVIVGLLYLMRQGIVHRGLVILPRMDPLTHLLPMEIYLEPTFGTRSKVVTETENEIKRLIRSMPMHDLVNLNRSLYSK